MKVERRKFLYIFEFIRHSGFTIDIRNIAADLQLTPELYNQLRGLQKKAKDLRQEMRSLRRMSQAQAHAVRETVRDTYIKIR